MENLYSIAKKVKSAGDLAQNENLLTGIFVWVMERYPHLWSRIIEKSTIFGHAGQIDSLSLEFEKNDLQLYCMDCSLDGSKKRPDAVFEGENVAIGIENKVVEIGKPNSLQHDQIKSYCQSMKRIFPSKWLILVITPDSEIHAMQELDSFRNIFPGKVCWVSWQKIWEISNDIIDSHNIDESKELILRELKEAIEMANLKPFNGFAPQAIIAMENLPFLRDEIEEFLNSVENCMEEKIGMKKVRISREGNRYFATDIWPEYIEMDADDDAIYYGPWFRFNDKEKIFSVYVEFRRWADEAHRRWKQKNLGRWNDIKSTIEKKWSGQGVKLESCETGYYLSVPINHNYLSGAELLDFIRDGIVSLRDDIIKPMKLKNSKL